MLPWESGLALVGEVGADAAGTMARAYLDRFGIDGSGLRIGPQSTQRTWIIVNSVTGSRTAIAAELRNGASLDQEQTALIRSGSLIYLDGSTSPEITAEIIAEAERVGRPVLYNMELIKRGAMDSFCRCRYGIMSKPAASVMKGSSSYDDFLRSSWSSSSELKGVTLGSCGSVFYDGQSVLSGMVYRVRARDTTGAGTPFKVASFWGF
jgi:sugar/nucleoside kinase (ribokinase family)